MDLSGFLTNEKSTAITLRQIHAIIFQILTALDAIHKSNLMHRDLKPGNILIDVNRILICDFGQTRVDMQSVELDEEIEAPQLTLEVGSRWYKAPELLFGSRKYS